MNSNKTKYLIIIIAIILTILLASLIGIGLQGEPIENTTTNSTTTQIPSYSSTTTIEKNYDKDFIIEFKKCFNKTIQLYWQGYDVLYEQYLLLQARYYYIRGDYEQAWRLLNEVRDLLENPIPSPEIKQRVFKPVSEAINVTRMPTINDFLPIGLVFGLSRRGYLVYPSNDLSWKLSCYIIVAVGRTIDGKLITYQGRFPMMVKENPFKPRISIGNKMYEPNIVFAGPIYVDNTTKYGGPTIYEYDVSGRYFERLTYLVKERTWIHEIMDLENNKTLLYIRAKSIGTPMWLGDGYEKMFIHGVYSDTQGFDLWLGFWDMCEMTGMINVDGRVIRFSGFFVFDRASHRPYGTSQGRGLPLAFSCIVMYQPGLTILVTNSTNPSPLEPPSSMEHELRINIYDKEAMKWITITTTNYTFIDNGGLQPSMFVIASDLGNLKISITGEVIGWWPSKWPMYRGTWWNKEATCSWGRAFIHWTGVIIWNNKEININAIGAGEFTRYSPSPNNYCNISCTNCNCYK